jgi:hypothetical protein
MQNVEMLNSTADLRKVQRQMRRRVVKLKFDDSEVQARYVAGIVKARLAGTDVVAFGENPLEAQQKLTKLHAMGGEFRAKHCDRLADREEWLAERALARSIYKSRNFNG